MGAAVVVARAVERMRNTAADDDDGTEADACNAVDHKAEFERVKIPLKSDCC